MKNSIGNFQDEIGEEIKDVGKSVVREVKDYARIAKKQIASGDSNVSDDRNESHVNTKGDKSTKQKTDPVTGKPVPKKVQLDYLTKAAAQLQLAKLKKVREELEKQRLKISGQPASAKALAGEVGPEMPAEKPKAKDNAVAQTLKGSKETGEFKGLIGG